MSMRALSGYLTSAFQRLKAKWAAARAKRRAKRKKENPPL